MYLYLDNLLAYESKVKTIYDMKLCFIVGELPSTRQGIIGGLSLGVSDIVNRRLFYGYVDEAIYSLSLVRSGGALYGNRYGSDIGI